MSFSFRSTRCGWLSLLGFVGCVAISPGLAYAQNVDPQQATAAQALFEQAVAEMDAGQFATACKKLEEVTRLVPEGIGGKLALGECYQRVGRLASAWSQYSFAQQIAVRLGQTDRGDLAQKKADELKPKLATLSVVIPEALAKVPGIMVARDGLELREPQWGTALYVDAGPHTLVVTAPDHTKWEKQLEVLTDGVHVNFPVPANAIKPLQAGKNPTSAPEVIILPPERPWQKPVGAVSVAIAGGCVLAGTLFGVLAIELHDAILDSNYCDARKNQCSQFGYEVRGQAVALGNLSTGFFVTGALLGIGGVVLLKTAPPESTKRKASHGPWKTEFAVGPASMVLRGSF